VTPSRPADPQLPSTADPVLLLERDHLVRSRQSLADMRAVAGTAGDVGGDAFSSEALGAARARRLKALADNPAVPPFFGRIDRSGDEERPDGETFHVGRRHIRDRSGDPLVIDWRAPMSRSFYRATAVEPMGVRRRRRFGFAAGTLTSYEDEPLTAANGDRVSAAESRILLDEIERPRVGPMRDIVATIQPDQDDLVRAGLDDSICVQGAPGTGKTAVGLHRAAYLLYTYPERLRRSGVLVVGPNRAFLRYIGEVLPALGEIGVTQSTVDELLAPVPVRGVDTDEVATLKGDARLAEVLHRAVRRGIRRPEEGVVIVVGTAVTSTTCAAATSRTRWPGTGSGCCWPSTSAGCGRPAAGRRRTPRRPRSPGPSPSASSWTRCGPRSTPPCCCSSCSAIRPGWPPPPAACSTRRSRSCWSGPGRRARPGPCAGPRPTRC
jgi:hypothetical protein